MVRMLPLKLTPYVVRKAGFQIGIMFFTDSWILLWISPWSFYVFTAISTCFAPVLTPHIMFFSQELIRGLREVFVFDVILCPKLRLIFKLFVTLTMHMCHHAALIFAASKQPSHSLSLQSVISFLLRPRGLIRTSVFPSASAWHTSNAVISLTPT